MSVFGGASACRLGSGTHRPFAGVTVVADYTAHRHKDVNNMVGGATAILTLRREDAAEEQLHVLPGYRPDLDDCEEAVASGGLEVLNSWSRATYRRQGEGEEVCVPGGSLAIVQTKH